MNCWTTLKGNYIGKVQLTSCYEILLDGCHFTQLPLIPISPSFTSYGSALTFAQSSIRENNSYSNISRSLYCSQNPTSTSDIKDLRCYLFLALHWHWHCALTTQPPWSTSVLNRNTLPIIYDTELIGLSTQ
ncbi:hypothetical protein A2U01_0003816 [Trifolium medium]|uniref:Uncharacterized protein n=1 Tax=Trifolium medium TaxID=97028 RepID=A0A392M6D3_9FABA|nr:hypothetical protein [Trifolium medium]